MSDARAFWDARCHRCKRKQGWAGRYEDRPACGHCGFKADPAEMKTAATALDAILDAARKKSAADRKAAWDARTPEQQGAYDEGYAAWRPNIHVVDRLGLSPYCGPDLAPDDPKRQLQRWFAWGWDAREGEESRKVGLS